MNVLPVITRELRATARHAFTYWLRVLGAGAVMGMAVFFVAWHGFRADQGGRLFQQLHGTLHVAIWILVPLLTADCLSRERREGTLGLLFLTPLKAYDIVVAKSLAHGLRAVTLLLAVLPVMALPLLMGGISWQQAASSLLVNGSAIALALAAGLLASALSKSWVRALILAFSFAGVFGFGFCYELGRLFEMCHGSGSGWPIPVLANGFQLAVGSGPTLYYSRGGGGIPALGPIFQAWLIAASLSLLLCLVTLLLAVLLAAALTARNWQHRPPHPLALWLQRRFCTPVVMIGLLQRWMKRSLDRNPIGWLGQRSWSGRLVIWGWFAVMISVYSLMLTDANFLTRSLNGVHTFMGWVLLGSMAINASTSFRRERETRVLELLLVSPLSESQIILGRLRGLWGQFFPSMALLLVGWGYLALAFQRFGRDLPDVLFFAASFAAVPVIGLYFSLVCRNFLTALIATLVLGLLVPVTMVGIFKTLINTFEYFLYEFDAPLAWRTIRYIFEPVFILAVMGSLCWRNLHRRLVQRRFATESA